MRLINFSKPVITYIFSCGRYYASCFSFQTVRVE